MAQYFNSFQGEVTGQQPSGTTQRWNTSSWTINDTDFAFKVAKNTQATAFDSLISWNRVGTPVNAEILAKVRWTGNTDSILGLYTRAGNPVSTRNGYIVSPVWTNAPQTWLRAERYSGGGWTNMNAQVVAHSPNNWYWIRAQTTGTGASTYIRGKLWADGAGEPGWLFEFNNSTGSLDAGGWVGVGGYEPNTIYVAQIGIGWDGDVAPSSMPTAYLGTATLSTSNGATLNATGTIVNVPERDVYTVTSSAGETSATGNAVNITDTTYSFGTLSSQFRVVGLRFNNILVPQGSTSVQRATLRMYLTAIGTSGTSNGTLSVENVDTSAPFITTGSDLTNRVKYTSTTSPTNVEDLPNGWYDFDVTEIVNQVIGRAGWGAGNALSFMWHAPGSSSTFIIDVAGSANPPQLAIVHNTTSTGDKFPSASENVDPLWLNVQNTFSDNGVYATTDNSSTVSFTVKDFNFSSLTGTTIDDISIKIEGFVASIASNAQFGVELSWDGGITWTTQKKTTKIYTVDKVFTVSTGPSDWSHTFLPSELSNSNFRVRVTSILASTTNDADIDYVAANASYHIADNMAFPDGDSDLTVTGSRIHTGIMTNNGDSDFTVSGQVTKLGVPKIMHSRSWLTNNITGLQIAHQQTTGNSNAIIGYSDPDPKFGDQTIWRVGQDFLLPFGTPNVAGIGFQTYGISGTETVVVNLHQVAAFANSGNAPLATKTVTLTDNYNEGNGTGTMTWYDAIFPTPYDHNDASMFFELRRPSSSSQEISVININNGNPYTSGNLWTSEISGTGNANPNFDETPSTHNGISVPQSDMVFRVYYEANIIGGASVDQVEGSSTLTASGQPVLFGTMTNNGDSDFTVTGQATFAAGMTNNGDSDFTVTGSRTGVSTMSNNGDSDLTSSATVGWFANLNNDADSTLTALGSNIYYATETLVGTATFAAAGQRTGVISLNELGDSTLTAIPNATFKVTFTELGNSTFDGTVGIKERLGTMTNDGNSTFDGTIGMRIPLGIMSNDGDSTLTAVGNVGLFVQMNYDSDSSMTTSGSKIWYGEFDEAWTGDSEVPDIDGLRIVLGIIDWSGDSTAGVDSTGIEITHLAITKSYVYKIYDRNWNYLGIWKDVVSDFGYSQEINSAGSAISVVLARNSDSKIAQYDSIADDNDNPIITDDNNELAAEMETISAVGPGTDVDLNHNVKIYEFSTDPEQPVEGDLVFTGYISMYSSKYGSSENTSVSIFSYGADLDNWLLTNGNVTRVGYISQDPSDILKDTLDRFNADGGIVTYDEGTPGATEVITNLVANPSFETDAIGWTVSQGVGGRATDVNGGAFGSYYMYSQAMGGSSIDWQSPNLVSGQPYRFSFYLKRPGAGGVFVNGSHNSTVVFDYYPATGATWQRYDVSFTATANSPLYVSFGIIGSDNVVYIDGVMLTQGAALYDYFDGATIDDDIYTHDWTGTVHGSTSTRTRVLTNIGETITDTNTIVTYAFNLNTELEVIKKLLELAPTDWYFYVDLANNLLHFHPRPETPNHYFYLGKHVLSLDLEKSMEGIVNDLVLAGGKPTNVVKDNFFAATGTLLHNHVGELNASWSKHPGATGNLIITNNRVRGETGTEAIYLVSGQSTTEDYSVIADMRTLGGSTGGDIGIIGRADPTALTFYMARWLNGTAEIYKRVSGTWTLLSGVAYSLNANQTYTIELQMAGNTISFKIDGNPVATVTDTSIPFGLRSGFRHTGTGSTATAGIHFNNFTVKHQGDTGMPVFKRKVNQDSVTEYRRGLKRVQDNRVTVEESAELLMYSELARNLNPRYRSNITISGSTYDIRSIKLGDLIGFRNFDNFIDDPIDPVWMQVVRLDYGGDEVKLQLDTLLPSVPKRLEDIKRNLNQEQVGDVGDEPDTELT